MCLLLNTELGVMYTLGQVEVEQTIILRLGCERWEAGMRIGADFWRSDGVSFAVLLPVLDDRRVNNDECKR
jgi:hypothetical protein